MRIDSIQIHNFRGIESFQLDFAAAEPVLRPYRSQLKLNQRPRARGQQIELGDRIGSIGLPPPSKERRDSCRRSATLIPASPFCLPSRRKAPRSLGMLVIRSRTFAIIRQFRLFASTTLTPPFKGSGRTHSREATAQSSSIKPNQAYAPGFSNPHVVQSAVPKASPGE
jgi:hypothetical protein